MTKDVLTSRLGRPAFTRMEAEPRTSADLEYWYYKLSAGGGAEMSVWAQDGKREQNRISGNRRVRIRKAYIEYVDPGEWDRRSR